MRIVPRLSLAAFVALAVVGPPSLCAAQEPVKPDAPDASEPPVMLSPSEMLAQAHDKAVKVVLRASRSDDPLRRMQALEAVQGAPERAMPLVQLGMEDPEPAVRFAALMTLGKMRLRSLGHAAQEMASAPTLMVRAAAAFAADRCGKPADYAPAIKLLFSEDPTQRGNAAMILGLSGRRSAVPMLKDAAEDPMPRVHPTRQRVIRVQLAEALFRLGDRASLAALHGSAYSDDIEVRVMSVFILGQLHDQSMMGNYIQFLRRDPIQLRLAAAAALAEIGRTDSVPVVDVLLEGATSKVGAVREQAAFGLARVAEDPRAAAALVSMLDDPNPTARLSAAAGVLRAGS